MIHFSIFVSSTSSAVDARSNTSPTLYSRLSCNVTSTSQSHVVQTLIALARTARHGYSSRAYYRYIKPPYNCLPTITSHRIVSKPLPSPFTVSHDQNQIYLCASGLSGWGLLGGRENLALGASPLPTFQTASRVDSDSEAGRICFLGKLVHATFCFGDAMPCPRLIQKLGCSVGAFCHRIRKVFGREVSRSQTSGNISGLFVRDSYTSKDIHCVANTWIERIRILI
jgi:hypothetical protein